MRASLTSPLLGQPRASRRRGVWDPLSFRKGSGCCQVERQTKCAVYARVGMTIIVAVVGVLVVAAGIAESRICSGVIS